MLSKLYKFVVVSFFVEGKLVVVRVVPGCDRRLEILERPLEVGGVSLVTFEDDGGKLLSFLECFNFM